jgi:threonine dehydrogenase-like Zn-dependent dehydrogenase
MRLTSLFSILSAVAVVNAESIPKTNYDVIIVGGGPSGLSALSGVSRVRRTALLFDNYQYRNAPTRAMHDVIGNDGENSLIYHMFPPLTGNRDTPRRIPRFGSKANLQVSNSSFQ